VLAAFAAFGCTLAGRTASILDHLVGRALFRVLLAVLALVAALGMPTAESTRFGAILLRHGRLRFAVAQIFGPSAVRVWHFLSQLLVLVSARFAAAWFGLASRTHGCVFLVRAEFVIFVANGVEFGLTIFGWHVGGDKAAFWVSAGIRCAQLGHRCVVDMQGSHCCRALLLIVNCLESMRTLPAIYLLLPSIDHRVVDTERELATPTLHFAWLLVYARVRCTRRSRCTHVVRTLLVTTSIVNADARRAVAAGVGCQTFGCVGIFALPALGELTATQVFHLRPALSTLQSRWLVVHATFAGAQESVGRAAHVKGTLLIATDVINTTARCGAVALSLGLHLGLESEGCTPALLGLKENPAAALAACPAPVRQLVGVHGCALEVEPLGQQN